MEPEDLVAVGNTAKIFIDNDTIVKVYTRATLADVEAEAAKQRTALALGLPVPAVLEVTHHHGKPAMVMERIPGKTMLDCVGDDWSELHRYMVRSVQIQREMHSIEAVDLSPMRSKLERQIRAAANVAEEIKDQLIHQLEQMEQSGMVCHGDFHLQNLIVDGDRVVIIDWMDATAGDPRLDVCRTYVLYGSVSEDAAGMYLREYCSQSGLAAEEILPWVPVIAAARMSETLPDEESQRLLSIVDAD